MKRGSGGKRKGAGFERLICRIFSLWMSGGKKEDWYWRSAMSGGRATVSRKKGGKVQQCGDIACVAEAGHALTDHFYIECKFRGYIDFTSIVTGNQCRDALTTIWKTTQEQAAHYKRVPLLIIKQNTWPILLITNHGGTSSLQMRPSNTVATAPSLDMYIGLLDEVLGHCIPGSWMPWVSHRKGPGPTRKEMRENY